MFKPVVTAEQLLGALFSECEYWRKADCEASIGAVGALSNVIAFATVPGFRADWHPEKPSIQPVQPASGDLLKQQWRVYALADDEKTYGENAGKLIITTEDGEQEVCGVVCSKDVADHIVYLHNIALRFR